MIKVQGHVPMYLSVTCHAHTMLYSNGHTLAIILPTTDFDHLNCAEHSAKHVVTSNEDAEPAQ